jgi:hypothetical protein
VFVALGSSLQSARSLLHTMSSVVCPALPFFFFPNYLINVKIFGKTILNIKVFWLSLQLLLKLFFFVLRRIQREMIINVHRFSRTCYFCPILMKLEFSPQIFEKFSNIKFHENPSSGSQVVHAYRHDEANNHPSQFCELSLKNYINESRLINCLQYTWLLYNRPNKRVTEKTVRNRPFSYQWQFKEFNCLPFYSFMSKHVAFCKRKYCFYNKKTGVLTEPVIIVHTNHSPNSINQSVLSRTRKVFSVTQLMSTSH